MAENNEETNKEETAPEEEVVQSEETVNEETPEEEKVDDRPEVNYKAEIERHKRDNERLRQELAKRDVPTGERKRDSNDITTWPNHELKMLMKSADASIPQSIKDQAEDLLLERKVQAIRERDKEVEHRVKADVRLQTEYPEAMDSSSKLALRMEQVMAEYNLPKSPTGRLAAAKIATADLDTSDVKRRKNESTRITRVKGEMADGDRPKSADGANSQKKVEEIEKGVIRGEQKAFNEALKFKGLTRDSFFGKR